MTMKIRRVGYYNTIIEGHAERSGEVLAAIAASGVSLLGFEATPQGAGRTKITLCPDDASRMTGQATAAGLRFDGPFPALHIQSDDDEPGTCADIFHRLSQAGVRVSESSGIAGVFDKYGVIVYLEEDQCDKAIAALES